jgi:hypothetical protein
MTVSSQTPIIIMLQMVTTTRQEVEVEVEVEAEAEAVEQKGKHGGANVSVKMGTVPIQTNNEVNKLGQ